MKKLFIALSIASLSFFGLCLAGNKKKSVETSKQPQLAVRPIVFVNLDAVDGDDCCITGSLESEQIKKQIDIIRKEGYSAEKTNRLYQANTRVCDKFKKIAAEIAKRLGACALLYLRTTGYALVLDSAYDITDRVIDQLNKEYLESIKICPTCKHSINNN